jgi:hypothetical protein
MSGGEWWTVSPVGIICVKRGYAFDGASIPLVNKLPAHIFWLIQQDLLEAALPHDVCYQAFREGLLPRTRRMRKLVDRWYRDLAIQNGAWKWRAKLHYRALRLFGWEAAGMRFWQ